MDGQNGRFVLSLMSEAGKSGRSMEGERSILFDQNTVHYRPLG